MTSLINIFWLGLKEIRSVLSDVVLVLFVGYAFTLTVYQQANGTSNDVNNASIAFVDDDRSSLSNELINAFYPPRFQYAAIIPPTEIEPAMDQGRYMFVVVIPTQFEQNLVAGRNPDIQVNIDATALQQAGIGSGYIKEIINQRLASYLRRMDVDTSGPVNLVDRKMFNPNGTSAWFSSIVAIINQVSLLTISENHVVLAIEFLIKRTLPSPRPTFTPPGCRLRAWPPLLFRPLFCPFVLPMLVLQGMPIAPRLGTRCQVKKQV